MKALCAGMAWVAVVALGSSPARAATVTMLGVGAYSSCALFSDGTVKCWGYNGVGELGLGDSNNRGDTTGEMGSSLVPVALGTGAAAVEVDSGGAHSCARLSDNSVKCWGYNVSGQLGLGDANTRGIQAGQMGDTLPAVALGTGRSALQLALGSSSTCALLDDHSIKCWGDNTIGELGIGSNTNVGVAAGQMGDQLMAVPLGTGRTALSVLAGGDFFCAILDDHGIKCWGGNEYGQLGQGDLNDRGLSPGQLGDALPEINVGTGRTVVAATAGQYNVCALLDNGGVKCWGGNESGQLGVGDTNPRGGAAGQMGDALAAISLVPGLIPSQISCGSGSSCCAVFTEPGTMQCWGQNSSGELGLGDTVNRGTLPGQMGNSLPLLDLGPFERVAALGLGAMHSCAMLADGGVRCWGRNSEGELGQGDQNQRGDRPGTMGSALVSIALQ